MYKKIVISHSREKFYHKPIWWYEFTEGEPFRLKNMLIPVKFLQIPETPYYEYGGSHEDALEVLAEFGFTVVNGCEL